MNMKKIIFAIAIIPLFIVSGCQSKSEDATGAILFADESNQSAYVICNFDNGRYNNLDKYKYNDKNWSDFIGQDEEKVKTDVIKSGDTIEFYNAQGGKQTAKCSAVSCIGRGIDDFTEVHAQITSNEMSLSRYIGFTSKINPMPRVPVFAENSISVDLDNNGTMDKIDWFFSDSIIGDYGQGMKNYSLAITINNKEYIIKNPNDLPLTPEDLTVFVMDLNGDGAMEVVIYQKLAKMMTSLTAYTSVNNSIEKMFEYIINPGP